MKLKLFIIILSVLFIVQGVNALQMLQPVTADLTNNNTVDIGYVSAGGSFLVSFLLQPGDNYTEITTTRSQEKDVIIENTRYTQESIFTTIKLNNNIKGNYTLNLLLKGKDSSKLIKLDLHITNKVIYSLLEPTTENAKYNKVYSIKLNIINKAQTTKQISIASDLPKSWFNKKYTKIKTYTLQPNSITTISYELIPQTIGKHSFNIYILTDAYKQGVKSKYINYKINIDVKKTVKGIYGSFNNVYPLFYNNFLPIYFLNKIINLF